MLIYGHEHLNIDKVKSSLLSCENMEHDNGNCNSVAFGLVATIIVEGAKNIL